MSEDGDEMRTNSSGVMSPPPRDRGCSSLGVSPAMVGPQGAGRRPRRPSRQQGPAAERDP